MSEDCQKCGTAMYDLDEDRNCPGCSDHTVPPAGDVEVLGFAWKTWQNRYAQVGRQVDSNGSMPDFVIELVDRAHVTRLEERCGRLDYDYVTMQADLREMTAERDEEALWRKEAREGWGQATKVIEMQRVKLDEQEAELTKARELLMQVSTDYIHGPNVPSKWFEKRDAYMSQSAPAAKGGE